MITGQATAAAHSKGTITAPAPPSRPPQQICCSWPPAAVCQVRSTEPMPSNTVHTGSARHLVLQQRLFPPLLCDREAGLLPQALQEQALQLAQLQAGWRLRQGASSTSRGRSRSPGCAQEGPTCSCRMLAHSFFHLTGALCWEALVPGAARTGRSPAGSAPSSKDTLLPAHCSPFFALMPPAGHRLVLQTSRAQHRPCGWGWRHALHVWPTCRGGAAGAQATLAAGLEVRQPLVQAGLLVLREAALRLLRLRALLSQAAHEAAGHKPRMAPPAAGPWGRSPGGRLRLLLQLHCHDLRRGRRGRCPGHSSASCGVQRPHHWRCLATPAAGCCCCCCCCWPALGG